MEEVTGSSPVSSTTRLGIGTEPFLLRTHRSECHEDAISSKYAGGRHASLSSCATGSRGFTRVCDTLKKNSKFVEVLYDKN